MSVLMLASAPEHVTTHVRTHLPQPANTDRPHPALLLASTFSLYVMADNDHGPQSYVFGVQLAWLLCMDPGHHVV